MLAFLGGLGDYAAVLRALIAQGPSPARLLHAFRARDRLVRPRGKLKAWLADEEVWAYALAHLLGEPEVWDTLVIEVARLEGCAKRAAANAAEARRKARLASYWAWTDEQLRVGGAGGLHRICRPAPLEPVKAVAVTGPRGEDIMSLLPQHILEQERRQWSEVWLRHSRAAAPWRDQRGEPVGDPSPG